MAATTSHGGGGSSASVVDTVEFISSLHGAQRRRERNIDRRDLHEAILHGTRELQHPRRGGGQKGRWKITWGDVVYITDHSMTHEITSWAVPLPLQKVPIPPGEQRQSEELRRRIRAREMAITSHTVLIVDQSGSMMRSDVPGHRNRSRCVFYNIAMEIISAPLLANLVSFTDVVTVIQMRDTAQVIVDKEPVSWSLFNLFVELAEQATADARRPSRERRARGPGNFIPALELASSIVADTVRGAAATAANIAVLVFLLSDGCPSDHNDLRVSVSEQNEEILQTVEDMLAVLALDVRRSLIFGTFGFASAMDNDFLVLDKMANIANQFGARGVFQHGVDSRALREVLLQLSSLLGTYVSNLSSLVPRLPPPLASSSFSERERATRPTTRRAFAGHGRRVARTDLVQAKGKSALHETGTATSSDFSDFEVLRPIVRYSLARKNTPRKKIEHKYYVKEQLSHPLATGIGKSKRFLERGSERVAFELREVDAQNRVVGPPLVWKEDIQ